MTPRLGGLGLRRVVDHADIAFAASRYEAQITSEEKWLSREGVVSAYSSQKVGSYIKDQAILQKLIAESPNPRETRACFGCET